LADSLETEQGRFEYYKKKLDEEKAKVPRLTEASPKVVELAMHEANGDMFPPMGFINFNKIPTGVDAEKFIGYKVDDIIRGTVKYVEELEEQPPAYLQGWGIANLPVFKDSEAAKNLVAKTKTNYSKISEEIYNLEDGEEADFRNPAMKKLNSKDLRDLLDSTMINFLKEIGVKRSESGVSNDGFILEKSQTLYDFLNKANPQTEPAAPAEPNVTKVEEVPVAVKEAEKMEPVPTSPQASFEPPQPTPEISQITEKTETVTTIVEKSQPPIEPPKQEIPNPPAITAPAEISNIATPETADQPVSPPMEEISTGTGSVSSGSSSVSTPLLDLLGASAGMSSDDIARMFQGEGGMEKLQQSLDLSFPGSTKNPETPITPEVTQVAAAPKAEIPAAIQTAIKKSEPAKMAEAVQPPPPATSAPAPEVATPAPAPESAPAPAPTAPEEKAKEAAAAETKAQEETKNKEQDQTNAELLKVMKDVLKTLQGPLIFTEGRHNFS